MHIRFSTLKFPIFSTNNQIFKCVIAKNVGYIYLISVILSSPNLKVMTEYTKIVLEKFNIKMNFNCQTLSVSHLKATVTVS